ncbi:MAG: conjugal transfer protein TraC [Streptosporangiales bacterium]|nr:conjugal transfer protein TraC [Streptosporangiales bacterium]
MATAGLGPDAVAVGTRALRVGEGVCASFAVVGYPAEVGLGWLDPLLADPGRVDVALHVDPVPTEVAADRLRRQRARLESTARADTQRGRLNDVEAEVAADDASELAQRLARGEGRLFRVGLYLTVHARDPKELSAECKRVQALAASLLLDAQPTTFRTLQGWTATLPLGVDRLGVRRVMDTDAVAAAFPFTSPDLAASTSDTAVLYGRNTASTSLVVWDRFGQDNYNSVTLARSGAGKSYLTKLETLRLLYAGVEVAVIDPEREYARLADAVGGTVISLGTPGVRVNPLDLPTDAADQPDALTRRGLFLHTLVTVLLGNEPDAAGRAALDRAIVTTYATAGITSDPRTWVRPAPLLKDLAAALAADEDPTARAVARGLQPYVAGSWRGLFDGPTTHRPDGHLVVFSLRDLPDEQRTLGTLLTLDATWRRVTTPTRRRRRLVVVDEAWLLLRDHAGAQFLMRLAKAARKHWCGLSVVTQDVADVLGSDLGRAVVANAATQILLAQAPQAIDQVSEAFGLTDGERGYLLAARRGDALLAAGAARTGFAALASSREDRLCTSDPADVEEGDDPC